jgi:mono/diheme cytochrome c family protein
MRTIAHRYSSRLLILVSAMSLFMVPASSSTKNAGTATGSPSRAVSENDLRLEGEQRFQTNCGRCHMAPHKFPPRMMATIIRHMRVRATLTDQDMHLILRYMTQ